MYYERETVFLVRQIVMDTEIIRMNLPSIKGNPQPGFPFIDPVNEGICDFTRSGDHRRTKELVLMLNNI